MSTLKYFLSPNYKHDSSSSNFKHNEFIVKRKTNKHIFNELVDTIFYLADPKGPKTRRVCVLIPSSEHNECHVEINLYSWEMSANVVLPVNNVTVIQRSFKSLQVMLGVDIHKFFGGFEFMLVQLGFNQSQVAKIRNVSLFHTMPN